MGQRWHKGWQLVSLTCRAEQQTAGKGCSGWDYERVAQADRNQEPSPSTGGKVSLAPAGMKARGCALRKLEAMRCRPSMLFLIIPLLLKGGGCWGTVCFCVLEQPVPHIFQTWSSGPAAVGPHRGRGVPVLRGVFFQLEVVPLLVPTALSECLPVLLTRAVAEAAFCSLGDWLKVCRTPRGAVAEPRDSWLEAYTSQREPRLRWAGTARLLGMASPCLADLFPPTWVPRVQSQNGHVSYTRG